MKDTRNVVNNIYLSFQVRVVILTSLAIILCLCGYLFITNALINKKVVINYSETSNLDYRVYLQENDFYKEKYLEKDMAYVASLIDKINIDYMYLFSIDQLSNIDFTVEPKATLVISDASGSKKYYSENYSLADAKTYSLKNSSSQTIAQSISIDYKYYNQIANTFRSKFGVDTVSNLLVYLEIKKENIDKSFDLDSISKINLNIPLSEKTVDINLDYKDLNITKTSDKDGNSIIHKCIYVAIGIALILTGLFFLYCDIKLLSTLGSGNRYDKYLDSILKTYDRFIVETTTPPGNIKHVIRVSSFNELIDARDNLKLPIMHYTIVKHQKSIFYINAENYIYTYKLKASSIGKNNDEK